MNLRKYLTKRNFSNTPEPEGNIASRHGKKLSFVVQEHHATALHYDFRLELDGVLKSWAVPKGPSMNPHDRHLAMMVEDHPFAYRTFEGSIPKGNYGAGTVTIWDKGSYEPRRHTDDPEKEIRKGLKKGHLTFFMHGKKLHGEFALIKMENTKEKNAWLLIKKGDRDAYESDMPIAFTLTDYPQKTLPEFIKPMLCTLVDEPFDCENWLFEMKWDGYRAIGAKREGKVQLYSRNNLDFRTKFAEIAEALEALPDNTLIDGEIVAVDKDGRPHFEALQNWARAKEGELRYYAFDLLWFKGHDVTAATLLERKQLLRDIIPKNSPIIYSDHINEKGRKFFAAIQKQNLEGMVAKRGDSSYQQGKRGEDWLKVKTHLRQEVVICGFTEPRGNREYLGSLILGLYKDSELIYAGHSGGGIPDDTRRNLYAQFKKIEQQTMPFATQPPSTGTKVHWVKPQLVCEVSFSEWTKEGYMRHPVFEGMRPDKKPSDVHKESASSSQTSNSNYKEVTFTHLDKVFWPERRYTKGDLITYYDHVSDYMLPYLKDRPQSLLRQPDGYKGNHFFQKDVTFHLPEGEKTVPVDSDAGHVEYLVATSKQSLLLMAQLGCIEINPWSSRIGALDKPDWGIIDLDPEGVEFSTVIKVARAVHEVCDELGISAYPKTSGKTGIHIFIPMGAKYSYEQVKDFVHLLVIRINQRVPKITSLERMPAKRRHKVYLDYLQNNEGQTLAAPYSVRPTKDASVSTPLTWDEVTDDLRPSDFTIKNMETRLKKVGDLWKPVLGKGIDMQKILKKLEGTSKNKI